MDVDHNKENPVDCSDPAFLYHGIVHRLVPASASGSCPETGQAAVEGIKVGSLSLAKGTKASHLAFFIRE